MKPKPLVNYNGRLNRILDAFFVQNVYFLMISVHFDWLTSFGPFSETIASWEQKFWLVADLESYFHVCHWWWHCDPSIAATFERSWCHPCSNCRSSAPPDLQIGWSGILHCCRSESEAVLRSDSYFDHAAVLPSAPQCPADMVLIIPDLALPICQKCNTQNEYCRAVSNPTTPPWDRKTWRRYNGKELGR